MSSAPAISIVEDLQAALPPIRQLLGDWFRAGLAADSRIETRSLPTFTRSYPRRFTFYVAHPIRSIRAPVLYEGGGQTEKKVTS